jgi:hypothetical protein
VKEPDVLRAAVYANGRVLVVECVVSDNGHQVYIADASLRILLLLGGKERTLAEFTDMGV